MDLDEIQSVQNKERQTDSLQQLRPSFYEDAGEFVQSLRTERDQVASGLEDPFGSEKVARLSDDIDTAEQTVEAIYERRVGKIVKMASLAAAGMPTEEEGLTNEERDLFEQLVEAIESNREQVFDVLDGHGPGADLSSDDGQQDSPGHSPPPDQEPAEGANRPPTAEGEAVTNDEEVPAADLMDGNSPESGTESAPLSQEGDQQAPSGQSRPSEESDSGDESDDRRDDIDRKTVRITSDVGEILGVDDREYELRVDDVVRLPAANAGPLLERGAAEPLE